VSATSVSGWAAPLLGTRDDRLESAAVKRSDLGERWHRRFGDAGRFDLAPLRDRVFLQCAAKTNVLVPHGEAVAGRALWDSLPRAAPRKGSVAPPTLTWAEPPFHFEESFLPG